MTASTRRPVFFIAPCLVLAAAVHTARLDSHAESPLADRDLTSPRRVFRTTLPLEREVVGSAVPTASERKDGYVAIGDVASGDSPGEWVATTPHGAHWFDARWTQVAATDLGRRYRDVLPVRFEMHRPLSLLAVERSGKKVEEFDRAGQSLRRIDFGKASLSAVADFDGDATLEYAAPVGKSIRWWRRTGEAWTSTSVGSYVDEVDAVPGPAGRAASLLTYSFLSPSKGTRLTVITPDGTRLAEWHEFDSARYSVVELRNAPWFVSHQYGVLRLRDSSGRPAPARETLYDLRTRYARGLTLASGHDVILCFNRHYGTSVLLLYAPDGTLVHAEHPGPFAQTLWAVPGDPEAFYVAVGPEIVRYHLRR